MFDLDVEMKMNFLEEAQNLLEGTEAAFIALDEGDHSEELIDKIFRLAHNFKSSAKTVGLENLSELGHVFEDVLTKIKNGSLLPDKNVCTVLLQTLDHFKAYVAGLKSDMNHVHDTSQIVLILQNLKNEQIASPSTSTSAPVTDAILKEPVTATVPGGAVVPPPANVKPVEEENLKVNRHKLDSLLNLIGELVVNQSMISGHRSQGTLESEHSDEILGYIEKLVYEIQGISISLRMTPIVPLFQKLKRIARDAGSTLSKTIQFVTEGEHVEVDKVILDRISDPLTHLVRNAVDHGLETDEERVQAGKLEKAIIVLKAEHQEDRIVLTLKDNGRGMNPQKLIAKAVEKGLISPQDVLSNTEAYDLIFKPGFSTKEAVTEMSGRGVGMDVVQRAISDLKGTIQIQTELGKGTEFVISLPLSLSILTGMVVGVDNHKYVVPVSQLVETVELNHFRIESSAGQGRIFNLRGEVIPIYSLSSILRLDKVKDSQFPKKKSCPGLITVHNGRKISFQIDQIFGQQQIVLKKLGSEMQDLPGVVAGAILSTGEPGLVLSLSDFVRKGIPNAS
jgi:two-component system chemotaxis sensor kinase CheA